MLDALLPAALPPRPPIPTRQRSQLETYMVLRRNPLELWGDGAYELDAVPGRFFGRSQLLVSDPEAVRHVLVTNAANYGRSFSTRRVLQPLLGKGLLLAEGAAWRHQRRTVAPALAPRSIPLLARHVVGASEKAEAALQARVGLPVELLPAMQELALDIAGQSMFSLETEQFGGAMRAMLMHYAAKFARVGLLDLWLSPARRSPTDIARAAFRRDWLRLMDQIIDTREAHPRAAGEPRDLFDLLEAARDPETGQGFDRAQLRDEVATLILAGHETTAVTLFWTCYLLTMYPQHADAIAAEAAPLDLSPAGAAAAVPHLPYTRAVVDETLRLYPPAFMITREALGPDQVAGRAVVPGTVVSVAPWVLHRHRKLWDRPEQFEPSRFLPGAAPPTRFAYLPFGAGPRVCVGAQFALTEAVIVLARLLRQFRLSFAGTGVVMPRGLVTTQPDRPVFFMLGRR